MSEYLKPNIDSTKLLTKEEQVTVENALKKQGCILVHLQVKPAKNDYIDDFDRGTVEYTSKCRNYSFHKVVIPDKTVIRNTNFTQRTKRQAIIGKDLTFIECNLVNNIIDPTWRLDTCNSCEHDFSKDEIVKDEVK